MDTDLEIIVKDNNIVLTPANVKAYMIMTLKGKTKLKHLNVLNSKACLDHVNIFKSTCDILSSFNVFQD